MPSLLQIYLFGKLSERDLSDGQCTNDLLYKKKYICQIGNIYSFLFSEVVYHTGLDLCLVLDSLSYL